jgi:8-oxo-dGTP diphosphatase
MKLIKVVCGVIWNEDKIFIARKSPEKSLGGYWEFPGGKIEVGEDPKYALERELREELGMQVVVGDLMGNNIHFYDEIAIDLIAFKCDFIYASFQLIDHDKYDFVLPKDLTNFKIAPADMFIIKLIKQNFDLKK